MKKRSKAMKTGVLLVAALVTASVASAEWHYGVGTGLSFQRAEGRQGFNSEAYGPVEFDVSLDPGDFRDLMETAYGGGGYATDGQWMIQLQGGYMNLEDGAGAVLPAGTRLSDGTVLPADTRIRGDLSFETTTIEGSVGYMVYRNERVGIRPFIGARYLKHELSRELRVGSEKSTRGGDVDWTDALLGVTASGPLAKSVSWDATAEVGVGDSNGTYRGNVGVAWRFAENWSTRLGYNHTAVDFEKGSKGDSDWYKYDVDESAASLNVMFNW